MRISDWSSDVCSSDLGRDPVQPQGEVADPEPPSPRQCASEAGGGEDQPHQPRESENRKRPETERLEAERGDQAGDEGKAEELHFVPLCEGWLRFSRSEEHTSELQSLMRSSYAVFCLKKKK